MGLKSHGGSSSTVLKRRIKELNIDVSHFNRQWENGVKTLEYTNEEMFLKNSNVANSHLKTRIMRDNLLEYKCAICNNCGEWNGKILTLQLDHINGDHTDNRLENLRFLCPNCHSQTDTYASKNLLLKHKNR